MKRKNVVAQKKLLSKEEREYVIDRMKLGWTPDIIIGRKDVDLKILSRTLYRRLKNDKSLDVNLLPMRGKRKQNGYKEKRGRQSFRRTIEDRSKAYPNYANEFGHLKGDIIIGKDHKSAVITFVQRVSKGIITLKI